MARSRVVNGVKINEQTRFSTFVRPSDKVGRQQLKVWAEWFMARNILATVALTDEGYAVYREGLDEYDGD